MVRPGYLSAWASQSNLPESTMAPPTAAAWPSRYLVVEWITMSETLPLRMARHCSNAQGVAEYLRGHEKVAWVAGVAKVLSTMRGTPWAWAARANFSMSSTVRAGLAMVSPNRPRPHHPGRELPWGDVYQEVRPGGRVYH